MDYSEEKHFVRFFIRKERRDRLLYELTTPDKRYDGVSRFCHQAEDFLDRSRIRLSGDDLERNPDFRRFVILHNEPCYILSSDYSLNEKNAPLQDAVCHAAASPEAVLILGSSFAVVFTEAMKGSRGKYLLCEYWPAN
ncbi:MAG: hypothetical protein II753_02955 [Spirochaetales bacterium]|nr:hypothetical protein [Spirochaetales bacterium]